MKFIVLRLLTLALEVAEEYAEMTDNPIDDMAVKCASKALRKCFDVKE